MRKLIFADDSSLFRILESLKDEERYDENPKPSTNMWKKSSKVTQWQIPIDARPPTRDRDYTLERPATGCAHGKLWCAQIVMCPN